MLIPYESFIKVRKEDYELLKKHSINYKEIENVLIQNYTWQNNTGKQTKHPYTYLCGILTSYADGGSSWYNEELNIEEQSYYDLKDKEWFDLAICNLTRGFDHFKNYNKLKNLTEYNKIPINIIEGFLVIESNHNQINMPQFDTVEEMLRTCYGDEHA